MSGLVRLVCYYALRVVVRLIATERRRSLCILDWVSVTSVILPYQTMWHRIVVLPLPLFLSIWYDDDDDVYKYIPTLVAKPTKHICSTRGLHLALDSSFFPIYKAKLVKVVERQKGGEVEEKWRVCQSTANASKQEGSRRRVCWGQTINKKERKSRGKELNQQVRARVGSITNLQNNITKHALSCLLLYFHEFYVLGWLCCCCVGYR